jgi:hypothetical protein
MAPARKFNDLLLSAANSCHNVDVTRRIHIPFAPVPVLHIFGSRSGISHLLQAPNANPSETAIKTVQIFRMRVTPAETP